MTFDISLSFDNAIYLDPQIYLFFDSIKDKLPDDTVIHITTNRSDDNEAVQFIKDTIPNTKFYYKPTIRGLKSRCQYMFHCFEIDTKKDWIIKMELDMIILKHLKAFENILKPELDGVFEPENRRVIDNDGMERRLWRTIYQAMKIKEPEYTMTFRENNVQGRPLFGTGIVCLKSNKLKELNDRWIPLTKTCERWIHWNIHPNEFAFTGIVFDSNWKWEIYPPKYKFNPIGHFREGEFPSQTLINHPILPDDTIILDYHRPYWLWDVALDNPQVMIYIERNKSKIPQEWWKLPPARFSETERIN